MTTQCVQCVIHNKLILSNNFVDTYTRRIMYYVLELLIGFNNSLHSSEIKYENCMHLSMQH